jgi:uncharacterized protein DUF4058
MPSPFPGMDPYLEEPDIWPEFRGSLLMCIRTELNRSLPKPYVARWDRYVWVDDPEAESLGPLGQPDTFVTDTSQVNREKTAGVATLAAPATTLLPAVDPKGKPFLKIIDAKDRRVVTVVEMLSPANKTVGKDGEAYLTKRHEYLRSHTNLVEIDLLRRGRRPPVERPLPPADYYIIVCRGVDFPQAGLWPLSVRDRLPTIPIPLDPGVEPVRLELEPCVQRVYDEARFDEDVNYDEPPTVPLAESDATWAKELIRSRRGK